MEQVKRGAVERCEMCGYIGREQEMLKRPLGYGFYIWLHVECEEMYIRKADIRHYEHG